MEDNKQYEIPVFYRCIKKTPTSIRNEGQAKKAKENHNLPTSCPRLILNTYVSKSLVFV